MLYKRFQFRENSMWIERNNVSTFPSICDIISSISSLACYQIEGKKVPFIHSTYFNMGVQRGLHLKVEVNVLCEGVGNRFGYHYPHKIESTPW